MSDWTKEDDVNDFVKARLSLLGLVKNKDYNTESSMSPYLQEALKGSSKTEYKTGMGRPDFSVEKYKIGNNPIPVLIENKFSRKKLVNQNEKDGIKRDDKSVQNYAVNGALHYARGCIASGKYGEVIAVGIAGDNDENVEIRIYYVFGTSANACKLMPHKTLDFLQNKSSFGEFIKDAKLSDEEKHNILIRSQAALQVYAKGLNKLMHNLHITAPQRVLYVSGMILAMQDIDDDDGLTPDALEGRRSDEERDGVRITRRIESYLKSKVQDDYKRKLMISRFKEIDLDRQRDENRQPEKIVAKLINGEASINKQIFTYIYKNIFTQIDGFGGHLDIMGELYSEFLKYALGDGKELGIVLTPPYVTKMMSQLLEIGCDNKVMDLAAGSAAFLISAMEIMVDDANIKHTKESQKAKEKIKQIKAEQLLGVEYNAEMFCLAAANMILRGDGSSNILKDDTFQTDGRLYQQFQPDRILLNPPFTHEENGMPFIKFGLDQMQSGLGAIIIQDSAGSGKAVSSNQHILERHTLLASIKMPIDLFQPMAGVQTSVYIFQVGKPHDFGRTVKFIDFRNDGYKRTERSLQEIDNPMQRYADIVQIYKNGHAARVQADWDLSAVYVEDYITPSGRDWNFDQHQKTDTMPQLADFKKTVADYLSYEVNQILSGSLKADAAENLLGKTLSRRLQEIEDNFKSNGGKFEEILITDIFDHIVQGRRLKKADHIQGDLAFVMSGVTNTGVVGFVGNSNIRKFQSNSITIDIFGNTFYRSYPFAASDDVGVFWSDKKINSDAMIYISAVISKTLKGRFDFGNKLRASETYDFKFVLPTQNGEIAFDYMEAYIKELEVDRVKELEAYLMATGLKDYTLTQDEQIALEAFENAIKINNLTKTGGGGGG